jgi:AcrR family transcriptional regulator
MPKSKARKPRVIRAQPARRSRGGPRFSDINLILEAARGCFRRFGVERTRLEDVAAAAGISRPLLYQFFSNRQALLDAAINKEVADLVVLQTELMRGYSGLVESVIEGAVIGVQLARRDNILADLMSQSTARHLPEVLLDPARPAHALVLGLWRPIFERARQSGELRQELTDDDLVEWLMSVQYMFLIRDDITAARQRELLALFVTPALGRIKPNAADNVSGLRPRAEIALGRKS